MNAMTGLRPTINLVSEEVEAYAALCSGPEEEVMKRLEKETYRTMAYPQMLSGHLQGRVLYFLAKLINAKQGLEIGMFTGYSSIWIARGLTPDGQLTCLEADPKSVAMATRYFEETGVAEKITIVKGDAQETLKGVTGLLDFIYIDADKENYLHYYKEVFPRLKIGGLVVADNTLWGGRVIRGEKDAETQGIIRFNEFVKNDKRVETLFLPIRDGIFIIRKIKE